MVRRLGFVIRKGRADNLTSEQIARLIIADLRGFPDNSSTPKMLLAGKNALFGCSEDPELDDARKCWTAMFDAELQE